MRPLPRTTPLEPWIAGRIGLARGQRPTPQRLAAAQLQRLNAVLALAARHSPFYRRRWQGVPPRIERLDQMPRLPLTTAKDLQEDPLQFLAARRAEVARVVTLHTSGTSGTPKRLHFSAADLADTIAFFRYGMATLVPPGRKVLILLPGERPDSVGDLLRRALAAMDIGGIVHGPVTDPEATLATIRDQGIDALVGVPVQVLALARHPQGARLPAGTPLSVLLTTDHVPPPVVREIRRIWGCEVFQHYGMTEMGYGGAVSCSAHDGYHLRESDLLFEIVDPVTGGPLGPGRTGEVVFSTLTPRAMPLIRYRTGDLAAWRDTPCPCGTVLRRMGWVQGRRQAAVRLADGIRLTLTDLDNVLFDLPGVVDFDAALTRFKEGDQLRIRLYAAAGLPPPDGHSAAAALTGIPAVRAALAGGVMTAPRISVAQWPSPRAATAKRTIQDLRV
ncbi:DVU_1553 family AMP-dependent CoA ligase [Desulfatitalea alkaliphila]|uniref:AMP-binding protein n=1 Tax=Desulfatitalea alkaliphila TaxID=2929485 RepID=A0AA41UHV9_9BACT|nr:AMP-binding protein [Desulfatitalea alkaliphila]MCJ8499424.1 AMP-binding protein [Desulfatitalea alkaliphila]